jgi:site-specific recombinase XerC
MGRPKKDYRIKPGRRDDGQPFFDLLVDGKKFRLAATDQASAEAEGQARFAQLGTTKPPTTAITLQDAFTAYLASDTFKLYKALTQSQRRSHIELIMATPASNGKHELRDSLLGDWLHDPEAPDTVRRIMSLCGTKAAAANHRLKALNQFFIWLLGPEAQAGEARLTLKVGRHPTNPCSAVAKATPKRSKDGVFKQGYTPFTTDQVSDWLHASKDDPDENRVVRLLLMAGARLSDLIRLNRGMIKQTDAGRVLTYTCEKGKDSAFRPPSIAVVPMVPELEALIAEVPHDQFVFIQSEHGRPYSCTESLGNRIRKWRRAAGLPEGLSAHSMRKAATHWWLRNHRDLIANNFSLKTIFGWATDKELDRYTRDFAREEEAKGMLIKLSERRKTAR